MFFVIEKRKLFFIISATLMLLSVGALSVWGLHLGIDFTGGSLLEVEYQEAAPDLRAVDERLDGLGLGDVLVQGTGEQGVIVRMRDVEEKERAEVLGALEEFGAFEEKRFTSIGPTLGSELREKAIVAISLAILLIILFVAFAFRHVSKAVASWKYGVVAIVALIHDVLIPVGVFAALGAIYHIEADALFVTALLAILGISVNDTIVVFDRIRENLIAKTAKRFDETVGISLKQTISRSINTSLTTLFVLLALLFLGPPSTRMFSLILAIGLFVGTYSSIFLASPLLIELERWGRKI